MDMMSIRRRVIMQGTSAPPQPTNLIDKTQLIDGRVWWAGNQLTGYDYSCVTPKISVTPGATYYLYRDSRKPDSTGAQNMVSYFDSNQAYLRQEGWLNNGDTKTIGNDVYYIGITIGISHKDEASLTLV